MNTKLTQDDLEQSVVRDMPRRRRRNRFGSSELGYEVGSSRMTNERAARLAEVKRHHVEEKGEDHHSAKSLRYYDAGFNKGWDECLRALKEMGAL